MIKDFLNRELHHISVQRWLLAITTVVAVTAVLRLIRWGIVKHHLSNAADGPRHWHDVIIACAQSTGWTFQIAFGVAVSRYIIHVPEPWDRRLQALITVVAIVQCGFWANALMDYLLLAKLDWVNSHGRNGAAYKTGRSMLRSTGLVVVWAAVALAACENLGIHVSTLVAGLGITGVAVAFATQNILSDLIASVSMLLDKPFLVGDFIIVDAFQGTVERIGVRTTRLRSISGELLVMANSDLAKSRLRNYGRMSERRLLFQFSVGYQTKAQQLRTVGKRVGDIIKARKQTRFDRANWINFGEQGLQFECVFYVLDWNYNVALDIQEQIYLGIYEMLEEENIKLAFGTQFRWVDGLEPPRLSRRNGDDDGLDDNGAARGSERSPPKSVPSEKPASPTYHA